MMTAAPNRPKVLVLLASFNGAPWLVEQLESIFAQEGVDLRIVIRDDGSSDGTQELLQQFADRVCVMPGGTPSGSAAQNFFSMIRSSHAEKFNFVAFSDQDDVWYPDHLLRATRRLEQSDAVGYSSAVTAFWSSHQRRLLQQVSTLTRSDFLFEGAGQGCSYVLKATFYEKLRRCLIGQSSHTGDLHYHDWTVYALARAWNHTWHFDAQTGLMYRQHAKNDTGARSTLGGVTKRLRLLSTGWYKEQIQLLCNLLLHSDPMNPIVGEWADIVMQPAGLRRRLRAARFCLVGGRRKLVDRGVLTVAAVMGWV